jgi:LysM repeat protein
VAVVLFVIVSFVDQADKQASLSIPQPAPVKAHEFDLSPQLVANVPAVPKLPADSVLPTNVRTYVVQPGDTLHDLAVRFDMNYVLLKKINGIKDPDKLSVGSTLLYYATPAGTEVNN